MPPSLFQPLVANATGPYGLVANGDSPHPLVLLDAYYNGAFPWFSGAAKYWCCPDPRCVLVPSNLRVSRSFSKILRNTPNYAVQVATTPADVARVLRSCASAYRAGQHEQGTWLTPEIQQQLQHLAGSVVVGIEVKNAEGAVLGGLYGLRIGQLFCGESMFSNAPNGSKIALAALCHNAPQLGINLIDCQQTTPHMQSMGAIELSREAYLTQLHRYRPAQSSELLVQKPWPSLLETPRLSANC